MSLARNISQIEDKSNKTKVFVLCGTFHEFRLLRYAHIHEVKSSTQDSSEFLTGDYHFIYWSFPDKIRGMDRETTRVMVLPDWKIRFSDDIPIFEQLMEPYSRVEFDGKEIRSVI